MSELSVSPLEHAQPLPGLVPESRALTGHCRVFRVPHLGGSRLIFVLFCFLFFVCFLFVFLFFCFFVFFFIGVVGHS